MTQEKRIDFNKLSKPANLQNSAVLRMLEEEEKRKKLGKPGLRRVEWPPTKEASQDNVDFVEQSPVQSKTRGQGEYATYQSKSPTLQREQAVPAKLVDQQQPNIQASVIEHPQAEEHEQPAAARCWTPGSATSIVEAQEYVIPVTNWKSEAQPHKPGLQRQTSNRRSWAPVRPVAFINQPPKDQAPSAQQPKEHVVPVSCTWKNEQAPLSSEAVPAESSITSQPKEYIVPVSCPWKSEAQTIPPVKPLSNQQSSSKTAPPTADLPTLNTWQPQSQQSQHRPAQIHIKQTPPTPTSSNNDRWSDKQAQQFGAPQQHNLTVSQEVESPQSYKPQSSAAHFEPPATLITLRAEPPISQEPSPVYLAQPAATNAAYDGINMRGDQKWPPTSVKEQTEAENQARIELAKGPVFRPRRVNKDYSGFFAQHAVTNNYPGYRAPPGTQYFTPAYQH